MSRDPKPDMSAVRSMLGLPEPEPEAEPTHFSQQLARAVAEAVATLRADGILEVEDANVEALTAQVSEVALESRSFERLPIRITKTLIHNDLVEEIYGTDAEIAAALRPFFERI